jgi:F420-non-reducing hydrogenase small subunit
MAGMKKFAVLQLSGCSGCEVALLNAEEWIDQYDLEYMTLVMSAYDLPEVEVLLISGGLRTEADLYKLRRAVQKADQIVAVGTCAISGGVANFANRPELNEIFLADAERLHLPDLLPSCQPIDTEVEVDLYLPGCPPTPQLFMVVLEESSEVKIPRTVCQECGLKKDRDMRPSQLIGFQQGEVLADICLVNQGYLCIGTSTRGGCQAICTLAGYPCVGCRGPSDAFIEKESQVWFNSILRVFSHMTDIPEKDIEVALKSTQLSMFLFQFADYAGAGQAPRKKEKVI